MKKITKIHISTSLVSPFSASLPSTPLGFWNTQVLFIFHNCGMPLFISIKEININDGIKSNFQMSILVSIFLFPNFPHCRIGHFPRRLLQLSRGSPPFSITFVNSRCWWLPSSKNQFTHSDEDDISFDLKLRAPHLNLAPV